jgi:hypothetical protein
MVKAALMSLLVGRNIILLLSSHKTSSFYSQMMLWSAGYYRPGKYFLTTAIDERDAIETSFAAPLVERACYNDFSFQIDCV